MIDRKKKLRLIQISLLFLGILILSFTYLQKNQSDKKSILTKQTQDKIKDQLSEDANKSDVFFNIEYSGLDLAGNRYILKSKEAFSQKENKEIVNMKFVTAIFYFKNETILKVWSDKGVYNNKTLDILFEGNLKALYEKSELFAQKADYSNTNSYLTISGDVEIKDPKGTIVADKLLFDIKNQKLNIASFDEDKINANIRLK